LFSRHIFDVNFTVGHRFERISEKNISEIIKKQNLKRSEKEKTMFFDKIRKNSSFVFQSKMILFECA
jgi:hypothetical protein